VRKTGNIQILGDLRKIKGLRQGFLLLGSGP
jgi:hypothetical protein